MLEGDAFVRTNFLQVIVGSLLAMMHESLL